MKIFVNYHNVHVVLTDRTIKYQLIVTSLEITNNYQAKFTMC